MFHQKLDPRAKLLFCPLTKLPSSSWLLNLPLELSQRSDGKTVEDLPQAA